VTPAIYLDINATTAIGSSREGATAWVAAGGCFENNFGKVSFLHEM
jgi:hypothetical protein